MKRTRIRAAFLGLTAAMVLLGSTHLIYGQAGDRPPGPLPPRPPRPEPREPAPTPTTPRVGPEEQLEGIHGSILTIEWFGTTTGWRGVALGEEETLRWRVRVRNVRDVRTEISPGVGHVQPGPERLGVIEGTANVRPSGTTTYTLRVSGRVAEGMAAGRDVPDRTRTVEVRVRRPRLDFVQPVVDQGNLTIRLIARNVGDADFPANPIQVACAVFGTPARQKLTERTFTTPRTAIPVGQQAELGEIRLTDRQTALSADSIDIAAGMHPYHSPAIENVERTFAHFWETKTLTINESLIDTLAGLLRGSIRLNNYNGFEGVDVKCDWSPMRTNDSHVEIAGRREVFTPPRVAYTKGIYDYRGYVNDVNATIGDFRLFSIMDGKIKVNVRFETGGGYEIRAWEHTLDCWNDLPAPDVNIQQLEISAFLVPGLENGRVTYTAVEVPAPIVRLTFVGAHEFFVPEKVERYIEGELAATVSDLIRTTLMRDDVRQSVEDAIDEALHRLRRITRIKEVVRAGNEIRIVYLE